MVLITAWCKNRQSYSLCCYWWWKIVFIIKLIRAKLPSRNVKPKRIINGMFKCKKNCKICPYVKSCKVIKATHTDSVIHLQKHHDCQSKNIIYLIQCKKCKWAQYIGETQETLETRFSQHLGYLCFQKWTGQGYRLPL